MPFGQHQDKELWNFELWNNQFPESKILRVPVSRRMRSLVNMASRDKVDVDAFHKGIQYALEKLGESKFGFERTAVSNFKSKRHVGSGNEIVDYSRAAYLGCNKRHGASGNEIGSFGFFWSQRESWELLGSLQRCLFKHTFVTQD